MIRTGIECLLEMAKNDNNHCYENLNAEIGKMKLTNILSSMEPLKKGELKHMAEAVIVRDCKRLDCYFVELGQLCDYMQEMGVHDFKEAITNIAEANSTDNFKLEAGKFAVLIDEKSCDEAIEDAKEASKTDNKKLKSKKCEAVAMIERAYDVLQKQGIRCILQPAR